MGACAYEMNDPLSKCLFKVSISDTSSNFTDAFPLLHVQPLSGICFGHCIFNKATTKAVQTFGKIILSDAICKRLNEAT